MRGNRPTTLHETHAHVLDVRTRSRSTLFRGREGTIITALGDRRFTLLELLGTPGERFQVGERLDISRDGRDRVTAVLGKLEYSRISAAATEELRRVVAGVVESGEARFVEYVNRAGLVTAQVHALSMLPGVGRAAMKAILEQRATREFTSYQDVESRTGWRDPAENICRRIQDELEGRTGTCLFVRR